MEKAGQCGIVILWVFMAARLMNNLNILHVIQTLEPRHGGPVTVLRGLAREQVRAGHRVTVYTTGSDVKSLRQMQPAQSNGFKTCCFPVAPGPILFSSALYTRLRNGISKFDIIHIHGLYRFPMTYAALCARKAGVPYIIRPHGSLDPFLYRQSRFGKWAVPIKRLYERLFDIPNLNGADAIHYTTQEEMERASFLALRAKPVIVPNGIDWKSYRNLPNKGLFRERLGAREQTPLVLFLGRINFKKGLDLLVPSFAYVLEKFSAARLAIVGPDNEGYGKMVRQWCREQGIVDDVFFVNYLGSEDVKQAYVDADVFVLPSYTENFGMTVVEAMACGCPVVISDQVNIWREVQEEGAGLAVGLKPLEIADAICKVLGCKDTAMDMGKRGRMAAERRYTWPRIVEQLTKVYREVIEEAAARRQLGN